MFGCHAILQILEIDWFAYLLTCLSMTRWMKCATEIHPAEDKERLEDLLFGTLVCIKAAFQLKTTIMNAL